MELILSKLSEIEITAQKIMEDAVSQKTALSEDMEQQAKAYDSALEKETAKRLQQIRQKLEEDKEQQLSALRSHTEDHIAQMKTYYEKNHFRLSQEIFEKILSE